MTDMQRLKDLQYQINQLHLSYLETEESPGKIEKRKKLEGYIREYLYLVPHSHKFNFHETKLILHRSVESKESFSAYKASNAWSALAVYAENLLSQPWRKEYHQIKLYSGYYKHHIESGLVGAEIMLEKMGYKHSSKDVSMVLDTMSNQTCIINISKDCHIAMVECQILRTIYEEVMKKVPCSWLQVLGYREAYICSPEQLVQAIITGKFPRHMDPFPANHSPCNHYSTYKPFSGHDCMYSPCSQSISCPPFCPTLPAPLPAYSQSYCQGNIVIKPHEVYPPYVNGGYPIHPYLLNYPPSHQTALPSNYNFPVPTGQLIELATPQEPYYGHRRSNSDHKIINHQRKNGSDKYSTDVCSRSTPSDDTSVLKAHTLASQHKMENSRGNEWNFMNQSVDSKNPSKSHLAVRETKKPKSGNSSSSDNLDWNESSLDSNSIKIQNSLSKLSINSNHRKKYENPSSDSTDSSLKLAGLDTSPRSSASYQSQHSPSKSKPSLVTDSGNRSPKYPSNSNQIRSDSLLIDTSELRVNLTPSTQTWSCANCTFLNSPSKSICEMCDKSRVSGSEMDPLISGGRECPKCTLVNQKDLLKCEACNTDLKDSSTYV